MSKRVKLGSSSVAVAYIRVSKEEQKLGPEAQRASIEAWARSEGIHVAAWHVDQGVCSVTPIDERPALVAALASLREHAAGVLVVAKRDRIARDVVLAAMVERATTSAGATIVSAAGEGNGDAPADAFMRTVIDGAAQYERALIRARTKAALGAKRAKGEKTGGDAPYGFTVDGGRLVAVENEQAAIARARELSAEGRSLRAVAAALAGEGHVSRTGRPFAAMQIARMVVSVEAKRTAA
ncbi:MAG: recombinase family protein [Polyangiaceae bacterium]|jgi:DNA invertase Pin-like site-specific DNA recombinase